jgi:hypothetical protein
MRNPSAISSRKNSSNGNRVALVLVAVLILTCCKDKPTLVNIAHGYSGAVTIRCSTGSDDSQTITVDSTGHNDHAACPRKRTGLLIVRDGKSIPAEGSIKWAAPGDGIPVDIQFTIR